MLYSSVEYAMATIRKLRGKWQAQVRRKGMAPRAKSFESKADAERWARSLEAEVDRCGALPDTRLAEKMTLGEVLTRYKDEITPKKRSAISEAARINGILRRPICHRTLTLLSTADLASYRDDRLKVVSPATVVRELNTISHAIDTARREWNIHLAQNPCKLVRRPSPPRGRTRRLKEDEEQRLLAAARAGRTPYIELAAGSCSLSTGVTSTSTGVWRMCPLQRRTSRVICLSLRVPLRH
jgi:hypothetical protein